MLSYLSPHATLRVNSAKHHRVVEYVMPPSPRFSRSLTFMKAFNSYRSRPQNDRRVGGQEGGFTLAFQHRLESRG